MVGPVPSLEEARELAVLPLWRIQRANTLILDFPASKTEKEIAIV